MNNDRFDDALRRKLEEVNPTFQEKNWTQLQRFMGSRGFPPSIWRSPVNWMQPAFTAAAAASLLAVSIWQYRTNQTLTDRIQTLTNTVSRLEQVQTSLQQTVTDITSQPRADTVYIVQRVPVPAQSEPGVEGRTPGVSVTEPTLSATAPERLSARSSRPGHIIRPADERLATTPAPSARQSVTDATTDETAGANDVQYVGKANGIVQNRPSVTGQTTRSGNRRESLAQSATPDRFPGNSPRASQSIPNQPLLSSSSVQHETPVYTNPAPADPITSSVSANPAEQSGQAPQPAASAILADVQLAQPLTVLSQSEEWTDQWQRRLRRVRYRSPYAPSVPTTSLASATPEKHTNPGAVRFRLGVGGELTTVQTGAGVYGEAVINDRLTLSVGLGQSNWSGVLYQNEEQFNNRVKRDFQREYVGSNGNPSGGMAGPGPGGPILRPRQAFDINLSSSALVIPVQVGYRLDVGRRLFVSPFVGMNMSLNPTEMIDCSYEGLDHRTYQFLNFVKERPTIAYSSWTLGASLERQVGPFVAQLSPMATLPMTRRENSLNTASVGLRARLYYQF